MTNASINSSKTNVKFATVLLLILTRIGKRNIFTFIPLDMFQFLTKVLKKLSIATNVDSQKPTPCNLHKNLIEFTHFT